jgi:phosphoglycolate phosphatase
MARIIFDLDGTLVHSAPSLAAAGNRLLAELGRAPVDPAGYHRFLGRGMRAQVERLLGATGGIPGGDVVPHLARYRAIYDADPVSGTEPFIGVRNALDHLAASGHGLGVCTQKPDAPARALLRALGLMPPIAALAGGDSLGVLKPDPRMLAHAADQLPPGEVVLVGDGETDEAAARNAGVPFIWFARGYWHGSKPPETAARFEDFATLPALVARVLRERAAT